ncbi:glycosyltransferase family 2 protein [Cohnella zeiphila]|uniref:Glycosyltransferase family 2 protein n=1 Tax=Cohnella zeiphila TaxID=2761120 RepID=A0A7X0VYI9_9BACL|nr:glycosyltransferase family 2 protein [Cohnella zeiphila]MBB6734527.1 glycosyltransferase family 2 protein [Cohnella zeiphila]
MNTDLVIVTFNAAAYIEKCLDAIEEHTPPNATMIVVDNGSADRTVEILRSRSNIKLIEMGYNAGYAKAVNCGMLAGASDTIVIMNPDVFVTSGWLPPLHDTLWSDEKNAIVAPKLINSSNQLVGVGTDWDWTSPYFMCEHEANLLTEKRACLAINGACFLLKRKLLDAIGMLDEGYFHYFEETDYCFNANFCGYRVIFCPASVLVHEYYPNPDRDNAVRRYWEQSEALFNRKWSYRGNGVIEKNP